MAYNIKPNVKIPSQFLKLRDWIDLNKLSIENLCDNPNAESILKENIDRIDWSYLSQNPYCINILEEHQDKIDWYYLSENENAIELIENNLDKINSAFGLSHKFSIDNLLGSIQSRNFRNCEGIFSLGLIL